MVGELYTAADNSFFFFQAEDGIRDIGVTGVQTCALPIFNPLRSLRILELRIEFSSALSREIEDIPDRYQLVDADRKSTRLNSSHANSSYAVFCLKKKNRDEPTALEHLHIFKRHIIIANID